MEVTKDGRTWRIGTGADIAWIADGVAPGRAITAAIPPVFAAYAVFDERMADRAGTAEHERAVLGHLTDHTAPDEAWWLGYLDTGAHDVVFPGAPRVVLHYGWRYVLVEAGAEQAGSWRTGHMRSQYGTLPDLIFPAGRSWLVSALWDDDWTCVGGPRSLADALAGDPLVEARITDIDLPPVDSAE